jgi:hypothetical protein
MRVSAEIIASDVSLLVTFNYAIEAVIQNNPKAQANPKAFGAIGRLQKGACEFSNRVIFSGLGWRTSASPNRFRRFLQRLTDAAGTGE